MSGHILISKHKHIDNGKGSAIVQRLSLNKKFNGVPVFLPSDCKTLESCNAK